MQHRQNPRRDRRFSGEELMLSSFGANAAAFMSLFCCQGESIVVDLIAAAKGRCCNDAALIR
jgi:hypothetical protein